MYHVQKKRLPSPGNRLRWMGASRATWCQPLTCWRQASSKETLGALYYIQFIWIIQIPRRKVNSFPLTCLKTGVDLSKTITAKTAFFSNTYSLILRNKKKSRTPAYQNFFYQTVKFSREFLPPQKPKDKKIPPKPIPTQPVTGIGGNLFAQPAYQFLRRNFRSSRPLRK